MTRMNHRLHNFNKLKNDAFYNKHVMNLNTNDRKIIEDFIRENKVLNNNEWEFKANRLFLDVKDKPKNWKIISEILSVIK